jgi:hypothetical protein
MSYFVHDATEQKLERKIIEQRGCKLNGLPHQLQLQEVRSEEHIWSSDLAGNTPVAGE